jgi:glucose/arabinose dehydrogenase
VQPANPAMVAKAIPPDYALGTHTASLGLTFAKGEKLGSDYSSGVFIGQHGSWNRTPINGYDVIFVKFDGEKPVGEPMNVLTGFVDAKGDARGRPVGVTIDKQGALLVADDTGNIVWRVTKAGD